MSTRLARSFALVGLAGLAGCGGPPAATQAPAVVLTPAPSVAPPAPATAMPVSFTSLLYDYSITLPDGWNVGAAMLPWDGASAPGHDDGAVDKFDSASTVGVAGYAGPVKVDLDQFVEDNIAWTVRDHGDTCPATGPEATEAIQIGGEPGVLLSWNCGILINDGLIIHDGTGYVFVMRDPGVPQATDAANRRLFEDLLESVKFPT